MKLKTLIQIVNVLAIVALILALFVINTVALLALYVYVLLVLCYNLYAVNKLYKDFCVVLDKQALYVSEVKTVHGDL